MADNKELFSQMLAHPALAESNQELLSSICATYPWFVLPSVIRLSLYTDIIKRREIINNLSLNFYANSYHSLLSASIETEYTRGYLFIEKQGSGEIKQEDIKEGKVIYEAIYSADEMFPKGRIVVTKSGLFYSEESEGYTIIKEVIAVNQKIDENGKKISIDKTAEIIELFLNKKVDKIIPQDIDNKGNIIDLSVVETDEIITESMAKIYRMQGLNNEAISIYRKLSLKNPEKIRYFAEIISSIEKEEENKKN